MKDDNRLRRLNLDIYRGTSGGKVLWQPRIDAWYMDRQFKPELFPDRFKGMSQLDIYKDLGCSARLYQYSKCFKKVYDSRINHYKRNLSDTLKEEVLETPIGKITFVKEITDSSWNVITKKWWAASEEEIRIARWVVEHSTWEYDPDAYKEVDDEWGELGAPTTYFQRVNIQYLYLDLMAYQNGMYALYDDTSEIEKLFTALEESDERLIDAIKKSPVQIVNFGDNLHCRMLPPHYFKKYVLPAYQKRSELLHRAGRFTNSHWDGDIKDFLQFAPECGLDGIEAATPKPQGDVTLEEIREAFGDKLILIDGIAAILFDEMYPIKTLEKQAKQAIELFAPRLVLGISDEVSSRANLERIEYVGKIVDSYNSNL